MMKFFVSGDPVPKQSFRIGNHGGYTDPRVTAWQIAVAIEAQKYIEQPIKGKVAVRLDFYLPDNRRRDGDNLSKAVLDACNGIAWNDDTQVVDLRITKTILRSEPGVMVDIEPMEER